MAITAGSAGALASDATNGPVVPALPAGTVQNDVIICQAWSVNSGSAPTITTPAGFTLLQTGTRSVSGFVLRHSVFLRVMPASPTAPSVSTNASDGTHAVCSRWLGVDLVDPEDVAPPAATTGASTTLTAPSITTVTNNAMAVWFYAQVDNSFLGSPTNSATLTYGGSSYSTTTGIDTALGAAHKVITTAGASGTTSVTATNSPTQLDYVALTVALRPAPTVVDKAGTDTASVGVTDTATLLKIVPKDVADTLTVAATDSATVSLPVPKSGSDTLTVGVTESATVSTITVKNVSDTLTVAISDAGVRTTNGPTVGTWTSPARALPEDPIGGSLLFWTATLPPGTSLTVETSVDNGATWQPATNYGPVARLLAGTTVAKSLLVRVTMTRPTPEDLTPRLHYLEAFTSLDSGRDELCPLGVFTLNDTSVQDGPNGIEIELSGADLARKVSRNRWDNTYVVPEGSNYADAIVAGVSDRLPGITANVESTERTTPRLFFGEQASNDPWTDFQDMATAIGHELFFDARGIVTLRPEPDPEIDVAVWQFDDDAAPTITSLVRRVTDENTYNKIVVTGEGTSNEVPVRAVAIDDDPASPTYFLGPYGTVTLRVTTPMVTTAEQAQDAADALLRRFKGATEAVEIEVVPMPALEPGDVVTVVRGRSKVEGRFLIDALRIPLGAEDTMRIVGRRQRS